MKKTILPLAILGVLDLLEVAIHVFFGWGCWGLQAGGEFNMLLVLGLALLFICTTGYVVISTVIRRVFLSSLLLLVLALAAGIGAVVTVYASGGWRIYTSGHNQGAENLITVAALNFGTVAVWLAHVLSQRALRNRASGTK